MDGFKDTDILQIAELLGISKIRKSGKEYRGICNVCGKDKLYFDREAGVFTCFSCQLSGGILKFIEVSLGLSDKKEALEFLKEKSLTEARQSFPKREEEISSEIPVLPKEEIVKTYERLLSLLPLADKHKENLLKRGLTEEDIEKNEYRSFPVLGLLSIPSVLSGTGYMTAGVPGFVKVGDKTSLKKYGSGFLIPIRDLEGNVTGFQIRLDEPSYFFDARRVLRTERTSEEDIEIKADKTLSTALKCMKGETLFYSRKDREEAEMIIKKAKLGFTRYLWISGGMKTYGKYFPGTSVPGLFQIHHRGISSKNIPEKIYLTEGALKADIFYGYLKKPIVAVPGVGRYTTFSLWLDSFLRIPKAKECLREIVLCFDMDRLTNKAVSESVERTKEIIRKKGIKVSVLKWDPKYKGIDDYLKEYFKK